MLKYLTADSLRWAIRQTNEPIYEFLKDIGRIADKLNYPCYVVGGFVRDLILERDNDDVDIVVVGKGQVIAREVQKYFQKHIINQDVKLSVFENFGTAQVSFGQFEFEFVGARKESYDRGSRKPIVEEGTLEDDQLRRDFTINAMAIQINDAHFGELVDPFNGVEDLKNGIIKTPTDPNITFSDDPLRMLRAVRFACKLGFAIDENTFGALRTNRNRLDIISHERIATEFIKIMSSDYPAEGIEILKNTGLLEKFLPEVTELDTTGRCGVGRDDKHKNIYWHTLDVLRNVASQSKDPWLRIAALLHDIGKLQTRHYVVGEGYSFENHEFFGAKMVKPIFTRLKLPLDEKMRFVELMVRMHMRPQNVCNNEVTDAAVRRLVNDAEGHIDDLLILAKSDITTKNMDKLATFQARYADLKNKIKDIAAKDYVRMFQPCVSGGDIMWHYGLKPGKEVGVIKQMMKDAILDNVVENTPEALYAYVNEHYYHNK